MAKTSKNNEERQPNYYAIIPATVRYDTTLPDKAKLLFAEFTALCGKKGYCWPSNERLASYYGISSRQVSKLINILAKKGYVCLTFQYNHKRQKTERHIYPCVDILGNKLAVPENSRIEKKFQSGVNSKMEEKFHPGVEEKFQSVVEEKFHQTIQDTKINKKNNNKTTVANAPFVVASSKNVSSQSDTAQIKVTSSSEKSKTLSVSSTSQHLVSTQGQDGRWTKNTVADALVTNFSHGANKLSRRTALRWIEKYGLTTVMKAADDAYVHAANAENPAAYLNKYLSSGWYKSNAESRKTQQVEQQRMDSIYKCFANVSSQDFADNN